MLSNKAAGLTVVMATIFVLLSACASGQTEPVVDTPVPQNQTGVAELDAIIAAALGGDLEKLRSFLGFTQTTCTFAEGLGGPPRCLDSEQEGTPVEVLPFLGPEGHFVRNDDIESWEGVDVSEVFAVYQVSERAYSEANYPAGEYAIVFVSSPENQTSVTLQVQEGRIVRIDYGFGYPPAIREDDVVKYLVSPVNTKP